MGERYDESDGVEKAKIPLLRGQHEAEDDGDILVETKKLWRIVGPAIFTRISTNLILVITQALAGHLGELELAAISIVSNVIIGFNVGLLFTIYKNTNSYGMLFRDSLESWYYKILILMTGNLEDTKIAVDSLSICMMINGLELMIPIAFLTGTGVRVANELGAGNGKGARFAMIISVTQSLVIGIVFSVLVVFLHDQIGWIFSSSEAVINAVKNLSILLAFTILLNSVQPVLSGVAVGSGWQSFVAYINLGIGMLLFHWTSTRICHGLDLQAQKASVRINKWSISDSEARN
uniref:Polysaccharide biosynthesis protein C-terminal domain-containing protein n=1 Tax=Brassica campestris TaxID=3711 RepID=M4EIH3_BRACM